MKGIYGKYGKVLNVIAKDLTERLTDNNIQVLFHNNEYKTEKLFEHIQYRIKSDKSTLKKCEKTGVETDVKSILTNIHDVIGIRIVCTFLEDIEKNIEMIRSLDNIKVLQEKDYLNTSKPSGYRGYHMIVEITSPFKDVNGNKPGKYLAEIQLRTIAMDTWASMEHRIKYKKNIPNEEFVSKELNKISDELHECDLAIQKVRNATLVDTDSMILEYS